jgi:hypothetical protein
MKTKNCLLCGKEFYKTSKNQKFCCVAHRNVVLREYRKQPAYKEYKNANDRLRMANPVVRARKNAQQRERRATDPLYNESRKTSELKSRLKQRAIVAAYYEKINQVKEENLNGIR